MHAYLLHQMSMAYPDCPATMPSLGGCGLSTKTGFGLFSRISSSLVMNRSFWFIRYCHIIASLIYLTQFFFSFLQWKPDSLVLTIWILGNLYAFKHSLHSCDYQNTCFFFYFHLSSFVFVIWGVSVLVTCTSYEMSCMCIMHSYHNISLHLFTSYTWIDKRIFIFEVQWYWLNFPKV